MFENLAKKLQALLKSPTPFDPARFNDPIALQTAWNPRKGGGSSFCTHRLKQVDTLRVEFRPTIGYRLFAAVFLLPGLGLFGFMVTQLAADPNGRFSLGIWIPLALGGVFGAVGGYLFYSGTIPTVFDKQRGLFWKSRVTPSNSTSATEPDFVDLDQIHALQLISEHCSGNKSSFYSYELNLVLHDSRRVNVVDHGNRRRLLEDATTLSTFLCRPLWDATDLR